SRVAAAEHATGYFDTAWRYGVRADVRRSHQPYERIHPRDGFVAGVGGGARRGSLHLPRRDPRSRRHTVRYRAAYDDRATGAVVSLAPRGLKQLYAVRGASRRGPRP